MAGGLIQDKETHAGEGDDEGHAALSEKLQQQALEVRQMMSLSKAMLHDVAQQQSGKGTLHVLIICADPHMLQYRRQWVASSER